MYCCRTYHILLYHILVVFERSLVCIWFPFCFPELILLACCFGLSWTLSLPHRLCLNVWNDGCVVARIGTKCTSTYQILTYWNCELDLVPSTSVWRIPKSTFCAPCAPYARKSLFCAGARAKTEKMVRQASSGPRFWSLDDQLHLITNKGVYRKLIFILYCFCRHFSTHFLQRSCKEIAKALPR